MTEVDGKNRIKFLICRASDLANDLDEDFGYLAKAFPGSSVESCDMARGSIVSKMMSFFSSKGSGDEDVLLFIPRDSVHVSVRLVEALAAKALSEGGVWLYEKTRSYPQYNFYAYRDKCAACRVSDAKALGLDRISSWIAGGCAPDFEFSVLKAGIDILYATYYRYLDVDVRPLSFMIEPTNHCNFKCRMCPYHGDPNKSKPTYISDSASSFMELGLFERVVDQIHDLKYKMITLVPQCRGEPLCAPGFLDMIRLAHRYPENYVSFSTNGSLLDEAMAGKLIEAGVYEVVVSFHSTNKETYRKLGIGSDFELVERNVKRLLEMKKRLGAERPRVRLKFVEMPENRHEFREFLDKWLGAYDNLHSIGICKENGYDFGDCDTLRYSSLFDFPGSYTEERCPCNTALWCLPVYSDGTVSSCISNYREDLHLGNVKDIPLKEMIYGEKRKAFLRACNDLTNLDSHCIGCQGGVNHTFIKGVLHGYNIEGALQMPYFSRM